MGYSRYEIDGKERGYGVPDVCNHEGCEQKINRGMAYLCYGCTGYFCYDHLIFGEDKYECFAGKSSQICSACLDKEIDKSEDD